MTGRKQCCVTGASERSPLVSGFLQGCQILCGSANLVSQESRAVILITLYYEIVQIKLDDQGI